MGYLGRRRGVALMAKRHYCSRCGLNLVPNISGGTRNIEWLFENKITMCEDCNPKLWEVANNRIMTINNKKKGGDNNETHY